MPAAGRDHQQRREHDQRSLSLSESIRRRASAASRRLRCNPAFFTLAAIWIAAGCDMRSRVAISPMANPGSSSSNWWVTSLPLLQYHGQRQVVDDLELAQLDGPVIQSHLDLDRMVAALEVHRGNCDDARPRDTVGTSAFNVVAGAEGIIAGGWSDRHAVNHDIDVESASVGANHHTLGVEHDHPRARLFDLNDPLRADGIARVVDSQVQLRGHEARLRDVVASPVNANCLGLLGEQRQCECQYELRASGCLAAARRSPDLRHQLLLRCENAPVSPVAPASNATRFREDVNVPFRSTPVNPMIFGFEEYNSDRDQCDLEFVIRAETAVSPGCSASGYCVLSALIRGALPCESRSGSESAPVTEPAHDGWSAPVRVAGVLGPLERGYGEAVFAPVHRSTRR